MKKLLVTVFLFLFLLLSINNAYAIFCSKCGKKNSEEASYCSKCGKKIGKEEKDDNSLSKCKEKDHSKYIEEVKKLIASGANVNAQYKNGRIFCTPLFTATSNNCLEAVKLLAKNGADIKYKDDFGYTLLHRAAADNSIEVAEFLIEKGLNINERDSNKETPLHCAALANNKEAVQLLIDKGADINPRDNIGGTPLTNAKTSIRGILKAAGGKE